MKPVVDILQRPYSERQLIIVQPDEVVAALRKAEAEAEARNPQKDWSDLALNVGRKVVQYAMGPAVTLATEALIAWVNAREQGLNVVQASQSEVKKIKFPPGHPCSQTLYVAHPALPTVYYSAASFHRMAFEHKFAEAINLLMSLGASKIKVSHLSGWSREFAARLSVPISIVDVNIEGSKSAQNNSSLLFEAVLNNNCIPKVPKGVVWYDHEPTWQSIAIGRMHHGLSTFSLTVNYRDDYSINAGMKVRAQKAGLDLGGSFEDYLATSWIIEGTFAT